MSARRQLLDLLSPELVAALEEHVREVVAQAIREERTREPKREWLTLAEAAEQYHCTQDAMRMRAKRGSVDSRKQGRRLYIRADRASRNGGGLP
jgi:hypothetical protein